MSCECSKPKQSTTFIEYELKVYNVGGDYNNKLTSNNEYTRLLLSLKDSVELRDKESLRDYVLVRHAAALTDFSAFAKDLLIKVQVEDDTVIERD